MSIVVQHFTSLQNELHFLLHRWFDKWFHNRATIFSWMIRRNYWATIHWPWIFEQSSVYLNKYRFRWTRKPQMISIRSSSLAPPRHSVDQRIQGAVSRNQMIKVAYPWHVATFVWELTKIQHCNHIVWSPAEQINQNQQRWQKKRSRFHSTSPIRGALLPHECPRRTSTGAQKSTRPTIT